MTHEDIVHDGDDKNEEKNDDVENFCLESQYLQSHQKEVYFSTLPAKEAKKKELELSKKLKDIIGQ